MDPDNLRTASLYINNQLLSRGLLRNGQNIEFARPDRAEGGLEATMGRVMSVVNDLILRRDRDATQRESLTTTLRTLRADALRHTTDHERLSIKNAEAQRKLGISESSERAMRLQLKSAESANRVLKEEQARTKVLVQQTRSQCAIEVRKRERVIEGLKKHVGDGRARGGGKTVGSREISVVAGVGGESVNAAGSLGVGEEGYDLRSETNEFLTELARGLSEENENLAALARRTFETLKSLSGWEKDAEEQMDGGMVVQTESGYENLAQETESVLEHVRTLLTNPSFVPLEEVEVREEEIIRLREGWERMESRWRDAVMMMDGWRKRMARSGQTVNLEELKMGLMLSPLKAKEDEGQAFQLSTLEEEGEGDTQADIDAMDDSAIEPVQPDFDDEMEDSESSMFEDEPVDQLPDDEEEEEHENEENYTIHTASSTSPGPAPQLSPLKSISGNSSPQRKEKDGFTTIIEENTYDLLQLASPKKKQRSAASTPQSQTHPSSNSREENTPTVSTPQSQSGLKTSFPPPLPPTNRSNSASPSKPAQKPTQKLSAHSTPRLTHTTTAKSQLPRPREQPPMQSPLTMASIAAKLAASEKEADAARIRAKIKAMRRPAAAPTDVDGKYEEEKKLMPPPPTPRRSASSESQPEQSRAANDKHGREDEARETEVAESRNVGSRKRKAPGVGRSASGKANRRRSTLSPWELESLILGGVGGGSPEK